MSDHKDRAEQIALTAESLERQMEHQGASSSALSLIGDVVNAARDLYDELGGSGE